MEPIPNDEKFMNIKRLSYEIEKLKEIDNMTIDIIDLNHWKCIVTPTEETSYANIPFYFEILFPSNYPFIPPKVIFLTVCLHPNVNLAYPKINERYDEDQLVIPMLTNEWSPAYRMTTVLENIKTIFNNPELKDEYVVNKNVNFYDENYTWDVHAAWEMTDLKYEKLILSKLSENEHDDIRKKKEELNISWLNVYELLININPKNYLKELDIYLRYLGRN